MSDSLWDRLTDDEQARLLALPDAVVDRLTEHWLRAGPARLLPMPDRLAERLGLDVANTMKAALHAWLRGADDFEGPL